jgi:ribulose bisphosphate carboxylase small subunit
MDPSTLKHTVKVTSNSGDEDVSRQINALLKKGYVLLHVGGEWGHDQDGKTIQHTVAILGSTEEEPAPPEIKIGFFGIDEVRATT